MVSKQFFLLTAALLVVSCTDDLPPSAVLAPESVTINSQEMAARFIGKVVRAVPNKPGSPPFMNGAPEHLRFAFDKEQLSKPVIYRERQLLVYPLTAYRELFRNAPAEQYKFDNDIRRLKHLILKRPGDAAGMIPVLPPVESIQLFCSQVRYLDFAGGAGIRFITRYTLTDDPTATENIFYTFQGLTSDGWYYISVFCPITAKALPENAVTLATLNFLNRLAPADFTPDLAGMDDMIKSLHLLAEPPPWPEHVPGQRPAWSD